MKKEKKEVVKDSSFHLGLVVGTYLVLDVIILFILCLIELNGVSHLIMLSISFVLEFLLTLFILLKSNIRSGIIFYILLLVSPVFLNLIAMLMHYITSSMPFTPTVLLLFRSGYDLRGNLLNVMMRIVISFRIPALIALVISIILYLVKRNSVIKD